MVNLQRIRQKIDRISLSYRFADSKLYIVERSYHLWIKDCIMKVSGVLDLVGNTPIVELVRFNPKPGVRIFAKLEGQNPSGSIKDRIVLAMVEDAEAKDEIKQGDTIVEASSGNTAIALALVAKQKGYRVEVVIPGEVAPSIGDLLELYGATITWCEPVAGMKGAIDIAKDIASKPNCHYLGQFDNEINLMTHYSKTAQEIIDTGINIDVLVAGIGTGGTITGLSRRLREVNPGIEVVGIEPKLGESLQGLRSMSEGYVPPLVDLGMLDGRFLVDSATAISFARSITDKEGILAGVSAGAGLHVALRLAETRAKANILIMFSDGGWKYLPASPWEAALQGKESLDDIHWW